MRAITAVIAILAVSAAWADPISIRVKEGLLIRPDETAVEVDAGLYLNDEAAKQVRFVVDSLEANNKALTEALDRANAKINEASAYIPGVPAWVPYVLGAILTVATGVITAFSLREAGVK